jgi:hypothetical protein
MTSTTHNDRPSDDEFDAIYNWLDLNDPDIEHEVDCDCGRCDHDGFIVPTVDQVIDALVELTKTGFPLRTAGQIWADNLRTTPAPTGDVVRHWEHPLRSTWVVFGLLRTDPSFFAEIGPTLNDPRIGWPPNWHNIVTQVVRRVVPCDADRNAVHRASDAAADLVHGGANPAIIGSLVGALLDAYTPGELAMAGD